MSEALEALQRAALVLCTIGDRVKANELYEVINQCRQQVERAFSDLNNSRPDAATINKMRSLVTDIDVMLDSPTPASSCADSLPRNDVAVDDDESNDSPILRPDDHSPTAPTSSDEYDFPQLTDAASLAQSTSEATRAFASPPPPQVIQSIRSVHPSRALSGLDRFAATRGFGSETTGTSVSRSVSQTAMSNANQDLSRPAAAPKPSFSLPTPSWLQQPSAPRTLDRIKIVGASAASSAQRALLSSLSANSIVIVDRPAPDAPSTVEPAFVTSCTSCVVCLDLSESSSLVKVLDEELLRLAQAYDRILLLVDTSGATSADTTTRLEAIHRAVARVQTSAPHLAVDIACPPNAREAARIIALFTAHVKTVECSAQQDGIQVWDERAWLEPVAGEEELWLAINLPYVSPITAAVLTAFASVTELLDLDDDQLLEVFAGAIGAQRLQALISTLRQLQSEAEADVQL